MSHVSLLYKTDLQCQYPVHRKKEGITSDLERCNAGNLGQFESTVRKDGVKNSKISLHVLILPAPQEHLAKIDNDNVVVYTWTCIENLAAFRK